MADLCDLIEGLNVCEGGGNDAESMANKAARACCCCPVIIVLYVILNIFHLAPNFELKKLYVPGLDKSLMNSSTDSNIIDFDIYFEYQGLPLCKANEYFDPVNVTLYDGPNLNHSIASFTIPDFVIEHGGKVEYIGMVNATGLDLDAARQEVAANGFKVFRMNLVTSVRYDLYNFWKTGRHAYKKSVDVKIGDTGAAAKFGNSFVGVKVLVLMVVVFLCSY